MPAPKGNRFWENRSKHGRDKLCETGELLWEAACEYFEWCDDNPWYKSEAIKSGDMAGQIMDVPTQRPYTIDGFRLYIGASESWWRNFRQRMSDEKNEDFMTVIDRIDRTIYSQKFEGAAVGAFSATIISRDLGLMEKTQNDNTNKNLNVNTQPLTKEEARELDKFFEDEV